MVTVEAAGIEPASRSGSAPASTCVACFCGRTGKSVVPFRSGRSSRRDQPVANRPWVPPAVPPVATAGGLIAIAEIRSPSGKARGSGLRYRVRQPERSALRHFGFGRLFTWPTDQPRHATDAFAHPVEASSPPGCSPLIYARHPPLVNKIFFLSVPSTVCSSIVLPACAREPTGNWARGGGGECVWNTYLSGSQLELGTRPLKLVHSTNTWNHLPRASG